jgi:hypothetical protein
MPEPIITTAAIYAAHKTFHRAHPHICNFAHKLASMGGEHLAREVIKKLDSKGVPESLPNRRSKF